MSFLSSPLSSSFVIIIVIIKSPLIHHEALLLQFFLWPTKDSFPYEIASSKTNPCGEFCRNFTIVVTTVSGNIWKVDNGKQCTLGSFSFGGGPRYIPSFILPISKSQHNNTRRHLNHVRTTNILTYPGTSDEDLKEPFPISGPSGWEKKLSRMTSSKQTKT